MNTLDLLIAFALLPVRSLAVWPWNALIAASVLPVLFVLHTTDG